MRGLGRLAQGGIEAGWLSTVILLPLFMDKHGSQAFDAAKAGLLRTLAIATCVAWLLKLLAAEPPAEARATRAGARARLTQVLRLPLVAPALLVLATTLLSTLLSLSPHDSFWGVPSRGQGALTLLSQLAIFFAVLANLETPRQAGRLVTALILPSLPVALYAIFQRFSLEPLNVTFRETDLARSTSLLGGPVFLGAYLSMVMPFTALRIVEAWRSRGALARPRFVRLTSLALYGALLLLQGTGLLFSESRGPMLGLVAGAGIALLTVAARAGSRKWVSLLWGLTALAVLAFALGLPARLLGPPSNAEQARMARRAADTFQADGSSGGQFRVTTWKVAERVLKNRQPLELADGTRDKRAGLRTLVGYGPELQYAISPPFYDAELPRVFGYFLVDRYHNELWDVLLTTGVLGLAAWLCLQSALLQRVFRGLGLLSSTRRTQAFWLTYGGAALAGASVAVALRGLSFAMLGLQLGALLGLALYASGLGLLATSGSERGAQRDGALEQGGLGVSTAALAALLSHLVETSFSFTVPSTGALFWVVCALVAWGGRSAGSSAPEPASRASDSESLRASWADGALLGLALQALGFAFLGASNRPSRPGDVLWQGLTVLGSPAGQHSPVVAVLALATLAWGTLAFALEPQPSAAPALGRRMRTTFFGAAAIAACYWLRLSFILAERALPVKVSDLVARQLEIRTSSTASFYLSWAVLACAFAGLIKQRAQLRAAASSLPWWRGLTAAGCACLGFWLVFPCSLQAASVEAATALGDGFMSQNKLELADQAYRRAVELSPAGGSYLAALAKLHARRARAEPGLAASWLERADEELQKAIAQNPVAGENATNLAVIRSNRVQRFPEAQRGPLRATLPEVFGRALRLNPQDPALHRAWASTQLSLLHDASGALASIRHALTLETPSAPAYALLAEYSANVARSQQGAPRRESYLEAAEAYAQASKLAPQQAAYRVSAGKAYLEAGAPDKAIPNLRAALLAVPASSRARQSVSSLLQQAESAVAAAE
ncbi:MAG: hypothetical protein JWN48_4426 [Myxococcaceae bacterium]|nr:hypothetical protein [Myxococcaceae bacterium]